MFLSDSLFCMILTVKSYFPEEHYLIVLCGGDIVLSVRYEVYCFVLYSEC